MTNHTSKQIAIDNVFKPDLDGRSEWISDITLRESSELKWGNNGHSRHGIFFGDTRYNWEKEPKQGTIKALRMVGFSDETKLISSERPIRLDIRAHHKTTGCVVCGSRSELVIDHKNDLYNDLRVLNIATQTLNDFQCLCNHCNLQKREVAKKTRETGKRYKATNIPSIALYKVDFIKGQEDFDNNDINAMVGTYWYDPIAFTKFCMEYHYLKKMSEDYVEKQDWLESQGGFVTRY